MLKKSKALFLQDTDTRVKVINDRINTTEKHLSDFCHVFAAYNRKLARYRDKNDELSKILYNYSNEEQFNTTLASGIDNLSKAITFLADFLDMEVHRIEAKVINELTQYDAICRNTRETLKGAVSRREKEIARRKQLIDIRSKFSGESVAANSELLKAKLEVNKINKEIDSIVEAFEKRKLKSLKNVLQDFILIQLKQYTRSLEILSAVYQDVSDIDEQKDFQNFRRVLRSKSPSPSDSNKLRTRSMDNLDQTCSPTPTKLRKERRFKSTRDLQLSGDSKNTDEEDDNSADDDGASSGEDEYTEGSETNTENDDANQKPSPKVLKLKLFCENIEFLSNNSETSSNSTGSYTWLN